MIPFALLTLFAVVFKLLATQYYTALATCVAAALFFLRYVLQDRQREHVDAFLLSFGVLNYALANRDPSYFEQLLLIFCVLPSVERMRAIWTLLKGEGTCLLLLAYTLWSCVWSANVEMTLLGLLMSAICVGFICGYIVTFQGDWPRMLHHLLGVLGVLVVSSLLIGAMGHAMIGQTFAGVTFHRNQFGFLLGLLILISLFLLRGRLRWPQLLTLVSGIAFLAYIDSKSAIISIVVTSALWLIASSRWWRVWSALALVAVVIFVVTLPSLNLASFSARMGRDPTLTSRTVIWADSVKLLQEQPMTGYGYNAVWSAFENRLSQYPNAPGPLYAHPFQVWLEWGLQLGVGGILLYLVFLGAILVRARALYRNGTSAFVCWQPVCLLVFVEIYNLANVSSVPINRFGFFVLAVASMGLFVQLNRASLGFAASSESVPTSGMGQERWGRIGIRHVLMGSGLVGLALVATSAYALWLDGNKLAAGGAIARSAPRRLTPKAVQGAGIDSYLESAQFQWTTEAVLRDYARAHHAAILQEIEREQQA